MGKPLRVLVVENSEDDAALMLLELRRAGFSASAQRVETRDAMAAALAGHSWDIILSDHAMPQFSSEAALALLNEQRLDLPFIIVSGKIGEEAAVAAMRAGAHDYIPKDHLGRLGPAVERELAEAENRRERRRAEAELRAHVRQQAMVAELGQWALTGAGLTELIQEAAERVAQGLEVEFSQILEFVPDNDLLQLRAGVGWKPGLVGQTTVSAGSQSDAGYAFLAQEPVVIEDLRSEKRFRGSALLHAHGIVSGMSVRIPGRDRPVGVLGAYSNQRRAFSPGDAHFLQAVANVLAAAVQRKQAEDLSTRLGRIIDDTSNEIYVFDAESLHFVQANQGALRNIGYSMKELARLTPLDLQPEFTEEEFETQWVSDLIEPLRKGQRDHAIFETWYCRKDGSLYPAEVRLQLSRAETPPVFVAIVQDITQRRRTEEKLRAMEARLAESQ